MQTNYLTIILLFIFTLPSCEKEDIPCTTFPCGDESEYYGNRVARDPEFRKGTWINITEGVFGVDTLVFHDERYWSNWNSNGGIRNAEYNFSSTNLESYQDYSGAVLTIPIYWETRYNDTTGIFSIVRQKTPIIGGGTDFDIDSYLKIE